MVMAAVLACRDGDDECRSPTLPLSAYCQTAGHCTETLEEVAASTCKRALKSGYDVYANDCGGQSLVFPGKKWPDLGGFGEHYDSDRKLIGAYSWTDALRPGCSTAPVSTFGDHCKVTGEPVMQQACDTESQ